MKEIEFIENIIKKLTQKLSQNSRNEIQHGLSLLFKNPEYWEVRRIPGLSSRSYSNFREFVFGETPWGLGWTYKVAEAFILPEKPEIWKEIEANVQAVNDHGINQHNEDLTCKVHNKEYGNNRQYSISVLKRDAPEIAQRVIDREISAAQGMRLAGKKEATITCKATVNGFYNAIKRKLTQDQITELKQML